MLLSLVFGLSISGTAFANELDSIVCPPMDSITDYDTDDIIWFGAGPYVGAVAFRDNETHLRVLSEDGTLIAHAYANETTVFWPMPPAMDAAEYPLVTIARTASTCTGSSDLFEIRDDLYDFLREH